MERCAELKENRKILAYSFRQLGYDEEEPEAEVPEGSSPKWH